jgi:hypothetical protein
MSSEGTQLVSKARRFLALQRTGEVLTEKPSHEVWDAAYIKELQKVGLFNRAQLSRQIAKRMKILIEDPDADPQVSFKGSDLVWRLAKELDDMNRLGAEEALERTRKLRAKAEAKTDEEEAARRIHKMLNEEGDNIEKAKAHGVKPGSRKRPCARMMCVKRRSPLKEEKVSLSHQCNLKKWSQQFLITAQGERAAKKLKVMLVSYSGSEGDEESDLEEKDGRSSVKMAKAYEKMKFDGAWFLQAPDQVDEL